MTLLHLYQPQLSSSISCSPYCTWLCIPEHLCNVSSLCFFKPLPQTPVFSWSFGHYALSFFLAQLKYFFLSSLSPGDPIHLSRLQSPGVRDLSVCTKKGYVHGWPINTHRCATSAHAGCPFLMCFMKAIKILIEKEFYCLSQCALQIGICLVLLSIYILFARTCRVCVIQAQPTVQAGIQHKFRWKRNRYQVGLLYSFCLSNTPE